MNKKKNFFIIPKINSGGAEKVLLNLSKGLSKKIYDVTIICFHDINKDNKLESNIKIHNLKTKRLRKSLIKLLIYFYKSKPDIVISSLTHINIFLLIAKKIFFFKFRVIIRESNLPKIQASKSNINKIVSFSYKYIYQYSNIILCSSPLMMDQFNNLFGIDKSKLKLLYNPIDTNEIIQKSKIPIETNKLNLNLVSIGRLEHQKGFDLLISTLANINIKFELKIIGNGKLKKKLIDLAKKKKILNNIVFLGNLPNPYNHLKNSDLVIQFSRWEGVPNVVLESLVLGKKIVFTDLHRIFESFNLNFKNLYILDDIQKLNLILEKVSKYKQDNKTVINLPKEFYIKNVNISFNHILINLI